MFQSTLEAALSSDDVPELKSTQDIDKYADFLATAISTAVGKAIPASKSGRTESQPVSEKSLALVKEKHRSKVRTYSTKIFLITQKAMTGWYDFSNVKSSKKLSFYSAAEAHGLIYPLSCSENFSFACRSVFQCFSV